MSTSETEGLIAPRVTPEYLESLVVDEQYHRVPNTGVTHCCLVVQNGYAFTGEAFCANLNQYDFELGKRRARKRALEHLLTHEQYLLRQRLYEAGRLSKGPSHE